MRSNFFPSQELPRKCHKGLISTSASVLSQPIYPLYLMVFILYMLFVIPFLFSFNRKGNAFLYYTPLGHLLEKKTTWGRGEA